MQFGAWPTSSECSHFLYSYSNYLFLFSCSIPLFSFLHFPLLPWVFIFQFLLFDSLIFDCLFYWLRALFVVHITSLFSLNCSFRILKSHSLSMFYISFLTYSFQPSSNCQSSRFSCTFFMILCCFETSSSLAHHHWSSSSSSSSGFVLSSPEFNSSTGYWSASHCWDS